MQCKRQRCRTTSSQGNQNNDVKISGEINTQWQDYKRNMDVLFRKWLRNGKKGILQDIK